MNQDDILKNVACICELEEKDYLKFLRRIGDRDTKAYLEKVEAELENSVFFPTKYEEVTNKIYLSFLSYCLSALKFLKENSCKLLELDKMGGLIENRKKLTKVIDVLEEYVFIDKVTKIHNERGFNKIIYKEMERAIKTDTTITLVLLQLDCINKTPYAFDDEQEADIYLENIKKFIKIVKRNIKDERDQLFRMGSNEFLIVCKGEKHNHICAKINYTIQEVMKSIQTIYLYFGITTITSSELSEDFNIVPYLKKVDQEVKQNKQLHNILLKRSKR